MVVYPTGDNSGYQHFASLTQSLNGKRGDNPILLVRMHTWALQNKGAQLLYIKATKESGHKD